MDEMTFRELYCKKFSVPLDKYEKALFRHSLYRRTWPFYYLLKWWNKDYFEEDLLVIEELAQLRNLECFEPEVGRFYGRMQRSKSFLRRRLKLRISGERLIQVKKQVLSKQ